MNREIEVIRNDLLAFDFTKAKEMGIQLVQNDYDSFGRQYWSLGTGGKLFINMASEFYELFLFYFSLLNKISTNELKKLYDKLDELYPDENEFTDVLKYDDFIDQHNIVKKILIPVELSKRNNGANNILHTLFFIKLDK